MRILSYSNYEIKVISEAGKMYTYASNPYHNRKIIRYIRKRYFGKAWNYLKELRRNDDE